LERNDDKVDVGGVRDGERQSRDESGRLGNERHVDRCELLVLGTHTKASTDAYHRNRQGCLYLEESNPPSKLAAKSASESSYALQGYYGYSFESYSTTPPANTSGSSNQVEGDFSIPNTNVQWCSVVKTNLGGFRTIVGGEVDCLRPEADLIRIGTKDFIELKTNIVIQSQRDEVNFER